MNYYCADCGKPCEIEWVVTDYTPGPNTQYTYGWSSKCHGTNVETEIDDGWRIEASHAMHEYLSLKGEA